MHKYGNALCRRESHDGAHGVYKSLRTNLRGDAIEICRIPRRPGPVQGQYPGEVETIQRCWQPALVGLCFKQETFILVVLAVIIMFIVHIEVSFIYLTLTSASGSIVRFNDCNKFGNKCSFKTIFIVSDSVEVFKLHRNNCIFQFVVLSFLANPMQYAKLQLIGLFFVLFTYPDQRWRTY